MDCLIFESNFKENLITDARALSNRKNFLKYAAIFWRTIFQEVQGNSLMIILTTWNYKESFLFETYYKDVNGLKNEIKKILFETRFRQLNFFSCENRNRCSKNFSHRHQTCKKESIFSFQHLYDIRSRKQRLTPMKLWVRGQNNRWGYCKNA